LAVTIFSIALAHAATSASGFVVPEVWSGVSLSTGSACADLVGAADIIEGAGGWVEGWVAELEFPEMSRSVNYPIILLSESFGLYTDS